MASFRPFLSGVELTRPLRTKIQELLRAVWLPCGSRSEKRPLVGTPPKEAIFSTTRGSLSTGRVEKEGQRGQPPTTSSKEDFKSRDDIMKRSHLPYPLPPPPPPSSRNKETEAVKKRKSSLDLFFSPPQAAKEEHRREWKKLEGKSRNSTSEEDAIEEVQTHASCLQHELRERKESFLIRRLNRDLESEAKKETFKAYVQHQQGSVLALQKWLQIATRMQARSHHELLEIRGLFSELAALEEKIKAGPAAEKVQKSGSLWTDSDLKKYISHLTLMAFEPSSLDSPFFGFLPLQDLKMFLEHPQLFSKHFENWKREFDYLEKKHEKLKVSEIEAKWKNFEKAAKPTTWKKSVENEAFDSLYQEIEGEMSKTLNVLVPSSHSNHLKKETNRIFEKLRVFSESQPSESSCRLLMNSVMIPVCNSLHLSLQLEKSVNGKLWPKTRRNALFPSHVLDMAVLKPVQARRQTQEAPSQTLEADVFEPVRSVPDKTAHLPLSHEQDTPQTNRKIGRKSEDVRHFPKKLGRPKKNQPSDTIETKEAEGLKKALELKLNLSAEEKERKGTDPVRSRADPAMPSFAPSRRLLSYPELSEGKGNGRPASRVGPSWTETKPSDGEHPPALAVGRRELLEKACFSMFVKLKVWSTRFLRTKTSELERLSRRVLCCASRISKVHHDEKFPKEGTKDFWNNVPKFKGAKTQFMRKRSEPKGTTPGLQAREQEGEQNKGAEGTSYKAGEFNESGSLLPKLLPPKSSEQFMEGGPPSASVRALSSVPSSLEAMEDVIVCLVEAKRVNSWQHSEGALRDAVVQCIMQLATVSSLYVESNTPPLGDGRLVGWVTDGVSWLRLELRPESVAISPVLKLDSPGSLRLLVSSLVNSLKYSSFSAEDLGSSQKVEGGRAPVFQVGDGSSSPSSSLQGLDSNVRLFTDHKRSSFYVPTSRKRVHLRRKQLELVRAYERAVNGEGVEKMS